MTMFANRVGDTQSVKVSITYGPVEASVQEEAGHLRSFHYQLGVLLDVMDAERKAAAAS